jgi:ATP-binding cassette subfamily C (CFTR/MRP) protein 4/polyamine-transporting ATPase
MEEKGGLDGQVTNDSLSVGEKQLLCICRAFLKQSKIVLVDEATANIDQKNDQLIQDVISTKFKESTVLTIAHRLSTLKNSDKILVLGEGKVLEWGSPQELMGKDGGIYREMCQKGNITDEYLI